MHEKNCSIFTKHELHGEFQCHKVVNFLFCSETVHVIQKVSLTFLLMYMVIMQIVVVFQSLSRVTVLSKCQNQATLDIKTRVCSEKSVIRSTLPQENRTKIELIVLHLLKRHLTIFFATFVVQKTAEYLQVAVVFIYKCACLAWHDLSPLATLCLCFQNQLPDFSFLFFIVLFQDEYPIGSVSFKKTFKFFAWEMH